MSYSIKSTKISTNVVNNKENLLSKSIETSNQNTPQHNKDKLNFSNVKNINININSLANISVVGSNHNKSDRQRNHEHDLKNGANSKSQVEKTNSKTNPTNLQNSIKINKDFDIFIPHPSSINNIIASKNILTNAKSPKLNKNIGLISGKICQIHIKGPIFSKNINNNYLSNSQTLSQGNTEIRSTAKIFNKKILLNNK